MFVQIVEKLQTFVKAHRREVVTPDINYFLSANLFTKLQRVFCCKMHRLCRVLNLSSDCSGGPQRCILSNAVRAHPDQVNQLPLFFSPFSLEEISFLTLQQLHQHQCPQALQRRPSANEQTYTGLVR